MSSEAKAMIRFELISLATEKQRIEQRGKGKVGKDTQIISAYGERLAKKQKEI